MAHAVDSLAVCFLMFAAMLPATAVGLAVARITGPAGPFVTLLVMVAVHPAYYIYAGRNGVTPGKRQLGIAVVRQSGEPMNARIAAVRYAGYLLSALTLGIGHLALFLDPGWRALQDRMAGTAVVRVAPVSVRQRVVAALLLGVFLAAGSWGVMRMQAILFRPNNPSAVVSRPAP